MPDRPGSLARLLNDIQSLHANVVDIEHNRVDEALSVDEVDIVVNVETRGPEHCASARVGAGDGWLPRGVAWSRHRRGGHRDLAASERPAQRESFFA